MPYRMLGRTLRNVSVWRLVVLTVAVYVVIRVVIPWMVDIGVPFWVRALFLALGPVFGLVMGPWLFPRRR